MAAPAHVATIDRAAVWLVYAQKRPVLGGVAATILRLLGIHIPRNVPIGTDLQLPHSTAGVVVNYTTRIGNRVTLFHGVTIGRGDMHDGQPGHGGVTLEDDVQISAGAVVLASGPEPVVVGRGTVVAANAVLTKSTGPGEIWAGVPARRIR